jgi:hypothetical protein
MLKEKIKNLLNLPSVDENTEVGSELHLSHALRHVFMTCDAPPIPDL